MNEFVSNSLLVISGVGRKAARSMLHHLPHVEEIIS